MKTNKYFASIKFLFSFVVSSLGSFSISSFFRFLLLYINLYKRLWSIQFALSLHLELLSAWNTFASPVIAGSSKSSWGSWLVVTWVSQVQVVGWASNMNLGLGSNFFMYIWDSWDFFVNVRLSCWRVVAWVFNIDWYGTWCCGSRCSQVVSLGKLVF